MPLYGKNTGEWEEIVQLYSNQKGVWVQIYEKYAIIRFVDYPYKIPTMAGWQYRFDDTDWETVPYDGYELNTLGYTFTGYVRANSPLALNNYYNEMQIGQTQTGTPLSKARSHLTSFVNGDKGYVCGGYNNTVFQKRVEYYDINGVRTNATDMSESRCDLTSFSNNSKGYVCGGHSSSMSSVVDVYDNSGNRTTGNPLSLGRTRLTSFVLGGKGYVCGGRVESNSYATRVDVYDSSGNRTDGNALATRTSYLTSFVNNNKGYVCGGETESEKISTVNVYDTNGNRTNGNDLSKARSCMTSFVIGGKGYVCAGLGSDDIGTDTVDVYDSNGNRTNGTNLPSLVSYLFHATSCVIDSYGYIFGGKNGSSTGASAGTSAVIVYDSSGNVTINDKYLSNFRYNATSFVLNNKAYVSGGMYGYDPQVGYRDTTDVFYHNYIAHVPITAGSTYTLNSITGTPTTSEVLNFEKMTTGTVDYKKGTI